MGVLTTKLPRLMLVGLFISTTTYAGGGKIHKWVDEKGVTHYGDKVPAKDILRDNDVLNQQGVVIRRNQHQHQRTQDSAQAKQTRRDRALLASYTSAEEIDLARDRYLQIDEAAILSLQQRRESVEKRLANNKKSAESQNSQQKPIPGDLAEEIKNAEAELERINQQIVARQRNMEMTRLRFDEDKRRFMEIRAEQTDPHSQP